MRPSDDMLQVAANRKERLSFLFGFDVVCERVNRKAEQHFSELVAQKPRWIKMTERINPHCVC